MEYQAYSMFIMTCKARMGVSGIKIVSGETTVINFDPIGVNEATIKDLQSGVEFPADKHFIAIDTSCVKKSD